MIEQGTEEWFAARLGKVTASRIGDVLNKGAGRKNYMMELLCQRLTGGREEGYTSAAMQRGIDLEPLARSAFEVETGLLVDEVGFVTHPMVPSMGASPDGLIGAASGLEIKCPNTAQHIACIQSGTWDPKYTNQMQFQMACTEREAWHYASFDDRLPEELQLFTVPVPRDSEQINLMTRECIKFLRELNELESEMREKMEQHHE